MPSIQSTIAQELGLTAAQVAAVIALIDEGNTIPFIARYRKEATGGIDDARCATSTSAWPTCARSRRARPRCCAPSTSRASSPPDLRAKIEAATVMQRVEDLYKPYKKKRATRASKARDAGLEPLALLHHGAGDDPRRPARPGGRRYVNAEAAYDTPEAALQGARDIVAEAIADDAEHVAALRTLTRRRAGRGGRRRREREDRLRHVLRLLGAARPHSQPPRPRRQPRREGGQAAAHVRMDADAAVALLESA